MRSLIIAGLVCLSAVAAAESETAAESKTDEELIRLAGEAYVKAFNAGDTKAVAALWSPEAVYTNRLTGEQVVGRDAIAEQFSSLFAGSAGTKLEISVGSIEFVSPNVAVEHGLATFLSTGSEPDPVDYSAVYVHGDGKWLLDRVTDDPKPVVRSNYEHLKELEWMIGTWVDEDPSAQITAECNWTKNKNFITRSSAVAIRDEIELSGMQIIGWDAANEQVRSWTFDSDGGFATARWTKAGNRWFIQKKATTSDGDIATAVNIMTSVDDDAFTIQSTQRSVGGEVLPNVDEVMVVRQ